MKMTFSLTNNLYHKYALTPHPPEKNCMYATETMSFLGLKNGSLGI